MFAWSTLAPGARVGWCAPGRYHNEVRRAQIATTLATPTLPQLAIAQFLETSGYEHHLRKTKEGFRIKLQRVDMTNAQAAYDYVLQVWV